MTTQTIVFIICYLLGVVVAFKTGKSYWIKKFIESGYVLIDLASLKALEKASKELNQEIKVLIEKENQEATDN